MKSHKIYSLALGLVLTSGLLPARDFQFGTMIRWGASGPEWELGAGASAGAPANTVSSDLGNFVSQNFQIGYNQASNTGFVRIGANQASFNPSNGGPLNSGIWTIPSAAFFVRANGFLTTVQVTGLSFASGVTVLAPMTSTTLTAVNPATSGIPTLMTQGGPIVFRADASGNWTLQGQVTMAALLGAGASGMEFGVTAMAADTPEPATILLTGTALALLAIRRRRLARR